MAPSPLALIVALVPLVLITSTAWIGRADAADEKTTCTDAHASGQELRLGGRWTEAAKAFRACSSSVCPQPVVQDCTRWHAELRALTPSVLVVASRADGVETVDARLLIDGTVVGERLPTTSVQVDPGEHTIRVERGGEAAEQRVILREGETDRRLSLRFPRVVEPEHAPTPAPRSNTFGIVMVGVGATASVAAATFGILGKVREEELASSPCGQNGTCATADVDVVRQRYLIAGVTGAIGVAALAIGLWYSFARSTNASSKSSSRPFTLTF